jgi:hypothetical protein
MIEDNNPILGANFNASGHTTTLDQEPTWKAEFRQTFKDILDVGFRAYTDNIRTEKLEELREKILEAMGLSEEDLENMPASQRDQIERMVALEIQKRLTAEDTLTDNAEEKAETTGISEQILSTPNGLGAAYVLMESVSVEQPPKNIGK